MLLGAGGVGAWAPIAYPGILASQVTGTTAFSASGFAVDCDKLA